MGNGESVAGLFYVLFSVEAWVLQASSQLQVKNTNQYFQREGFSDGLVPIFKRILRVYKQSTS